MLMAKIKSCLPFIFSICVVLLFSFKRATFLKFYPPVCNFCIFILFFSSLFARETIIQKIAKAMGDKLEGRVKTYTRNLTYVWSVFLFINLLISIWTIFLPDKIWILYNGCISYVLTGLLFGVEYIVRVIFIKRKVC